MTKLKIISKLWSSIYDLLLYIKGTPSKQMEEIERELDVLEYECRELEEDEPEERETDERI